MNWGHSSGYYNSIWIDDSDAIFEGTGAAVDVGTITSVGSMTFNTGYTLNGGSVTMTGAGGHFVTNAGTTTINSSISGSVGLTKQGSGTLTLNGANFYSGITTISGGELLVNGSLSSQSTVSVQNGTLGGSGFIGGAVSVGSLGTLSPGDSIGTLTISNALSLAGNTIMEVNESGTTLTGDRIIDVTTLTYGGMLSVLGSGNDFAIGDAWDLFSANAYEGSFNSYSLPSLPNGLSWNTSQLSYNGTISVVPEPGTLTLLAVGLASLLAYAWPKRK
jgi:autotransporter-associated beta strand protein